MRRIIMIIGACGTLVALSAVGTVSASASPARPQSPATRAATAVPAATFQDLCFDKGNSLCLSTTTQQGATGLRVQTDIDTTPGVDEAISITITTACKTGKVSQANNCPFDVGSGLNKLLNGDPIYLLEFTNADTCIGIGSTGSNYKDLFTRDCQTGFGRWWVSDGTYAYANVAGSDAYFEAGAQPGSDEAYLSAQIDPPEDLPIFAEGFDQWFTPPPSN
jgi:hypothetical protein